jgi:hypothetical protein
LNETGGGDHEGYEGGSHSETKGRSTFWAACSRIVMVIAMIVQFIFIVVMIV